MKTKPIVYFAVIGAMLCWSMTFIWYKEALEFLKPATLVAARLVVSLVLLYPFLLVTGKFNKPEKSDIKFFFLLALFQPFLYFLGESSGMQYVTPTIGAVVISMIPLFVPIADRFFYGKKLPARNIIGIVISVAGVLIVVWHKDSNLAGSVAGFLWLGLAVFSAVFYAVIVFKLSAKYNALTITTVQNSIGLIYFVPVILIFEMKYLAGIELNAELILPVVELGIFGSTLAFLFFTYAIKHLGISRANVFPNLIPVFTAILAFFLYGESLTTQKIFGIIIVISGLMTAQIKRRKKTAENQDALPKG